MYYLNEKQSMCVCVCLETGLTKFFHTSAQMGMHKMCLGRILKKQFS